ncbi:chemotaxis protein CheB [Gloeobacter kilaueensis]|uniref:Signal transduction histidine kinase with CheB and CheR activity n=1 Tax=Gloeobacter kilaueensis (strain ATCC BAA-2537 / CCAP 1431/1 / ULC 316 / JS1) TaxID=1183438 RepID=U5QFU5_GLOK1|nr:chemotaxis protein CheB [Gloeobacter kilaueensis]AGY56565.1 signal transduction histidine kinase with CheB and CheR activity [Gloeobacter kilaueensis JS1]
MTSDSPSEPIDAQDTLFVEEQDDSPFPVAGIGASAGGLEAFTELVGALPAATGMAFVLVQHLSPDQPSLLRDILARTTEIPVLEVTDGMAVEPDHIYVLPPNRQMTIAENTLRLFPRQRTRGRFMPIDAFFISLAKERGRKAIGVVLSGTDGDGSVGLEAIKAAGGMAFAQDEQSSQFTGMPLSAAATGHVDFILPPAAIAAELARIGHHPYLHRPVLNRTRASSDEQSLSAIVRLLHNATAVDFSEYKRPTFLRRVLRRMVLHRLENLDDYVRFLEQHPEEVLALYRDVLINVTSFFRDWEAFDGLKSSVFPTIIERKPLDIPIRIWVPGCATGEEVYSIAICLYEYLEDNKVKSTVQIFGTDISELSIEQARSGVYQPGQVKGLSPERMQRFFIQHEGAYQVAQHLREMCVFARQNLIADPPFSRLDLISCRNVLIYFSPALQRKALLTFHYSLKPDGFLLLGSTETPGDSSGLFTQIDRKQKLYARKLVPSRLPVEIIPNTALATVPSSERRISDEVASDFNLQQEADRLILDRYSPAGVVINTDLDILHYRGEIGPFIKPAAGRASLSLLKLVRSELRPELRTALHQAKKQLLPIRREGVTLRDENRSRNIRIEVIPFKSATRENYFLVLFVDEPLIEAPEPPVSRPRRQNQQEQRILELQQQLLAKEEYLRSTVEELEASNQSLRVANEEILSSNEELQSTNEELQTAKEEIQAANEELNTVNDELQRRNHELSLASNDLQNLLVSTQIPILMLDGGLRIRRFTPPAGVLFNLIPTDLGRPLRDINHQLNISDLTEQIASVISSLSPLSQEVRDQQGHWYELRVRPYRTLDNKIEGAVLVLMDIDGLKRSAEELATARDYAEALVDTVPEPLLALDTDLRVLRANRAFYDELFCVPQLIEGRLLFEIGDGQWDLPELRAGLESLVQNEGQMVDLEIEGDFQGVGHRVLVLNARRTSRSQGEGSQILLAFSDITVRKRLEAERAQLLDISETARRDAEQANQAKDNFLATLSHELRTPLNPIIGFAQLLLRRPDLPAEMSQALQAIERNGRLQAQLIDDMLDVARIESGRLRIERRAIEMAAIVRTVVEGLQASATAKDLTIETELERECPLFADPLRMQQIVWNLLTNAIKFTPASGRITIRLTQDDRQVQLLVRDTGIGIQPEFLPQVFERFRRADTSTTRRYEGLGLGLFLVRHIVEVHDGSVRAESDGENLGSTFTVILPRYDGPL